MVAGVEKEYFIALNRALKLKKIMLCNYVVKKP